MPVHEFPRQAWSRLAHYGILIFCLMHAVAFNYRRLSERFACGTHAAQTHRLVI